MRPMIIKNQIRGLDAVPMRAWRSWGGAMPATIHIRRKRQRWCHMIPALMTVGQSTTRATPTAPTACWIVCAPCMASRRRDSDTSQLFTQLPARSQSRDKPDR